MNRRQLLALAATAFAEGALSAANPGRPRQHAVDDLLSDPQLQQLGMRCLELLPHDAAVLAEKAGLHDVTSVDAHTLQTFAARRSADFAAGRIHLVDGWVMAEAECALCALLALS